jgi:hypothetical protein
MRCDKIHHQICAVLEELGALYTPVRVGPADPFRDEIRASARSDRCYAVPALSLRKSVVSQFSGHNECMSMSIDVTRH